jgi:dTDP-4-amino-4,6-dideoxygalactose transaminase
MPSYTFVSTANAFVLRGATPVFVDIRPDTMNIDEAYISDAITKRTRAIVPVHYAGVSCNMHFINELARDRGIHVIEDAAQGIGAKFYGRALGAMGHLGALSFHETKNVIAGEGGAILINDDLFAERAEILREKGTNRSKFFRGQVDKYTWVDLGSSYLPGEIIAAFLWAQLQEVQRITEKRLDLWHRYHHAFEELEKEGYLRRPQIPDGCDHNAHIYFILLNTAHLRDKFIEKMKGEGVNCVFHYIPLHSSPAGRMYGRASGSLDVTTALSERLVRLPIWTDLTIDDHARVIAATAKWVRALA